MPYHQTMTSQIMKIPMHHIVRGLALSLLLSFSGHTMSQNLAPSPEQIQMFQNLSPAQQQQMAAEAGIDLSALGGGSTPASRQPDLSDQPTDEARDQASLDRDRNRDDERDDNAERADQRDGLPLFGRQFFRAGPDSFRPAVDIPVPADYVMGPGDTIIVQLYGKENQVYPLVINREGQVQFPQIGPLSLAGLSFQQAQRVIESTIQEQMIGVRASITMGTLRTIRVFVLGEVSRPGSFTVGSLATMTNALFASGGITDVGSLRNIQLKRQGQVVTSLDIYDLLLSGDTSKDVRLLPGDVIFVPPIGKTVGITGPVNRPARYELHENATTQDLIGLAGGLKNTAHLPVSYLVRLDDFGERTLISVNLATPEGQKLAVRDGDLLSIASTLDFINNQVTLAGHAKRVGPRSWREGLRFTDLVPSPRELLPNPDIDIALIQRFSLATRKVEAKLFSPTEAWNAPGTAADPLLQGYDLVHIFNYQNQRSSQLLDLIDQLKAQASFHERQQVVSISGNVRFPGDYPLSENMTSRELIDLAGGLTESAIGTHGEITRYDLDEQRQRMVMHINVDFTQEPVDLEPGDSLQVKQIPLWTQRETVEIRGEVMFPGTYSILPGETLVDVITRAGGLTPHAYPMGAVYSRQELRDLEQQRLTELQSKLRSDIAAASVSQSTGHDTIDVTEAEALLRNLDSIRPLGRMVIDLPQILARPGRHDFQVEDGDTLTVPRYKPSVTVVGEVQYPTSHFYDESLDAMTYIERSGGLKKHADARRIYIVKANGSVSQPQTSAWFRARSDSIQPGDTIVIPMETDRIDGLEVWARATQIIYQAALGAAALSGL